MDDTCNTVSNKKEKKKKKEKEKRKQLQDDVMETHSVSLCVRNHFQSAIGDRRITLTKGQ